MKWKRANREEGRGRDESSRVPRPLDEEKNENKYVNLKNRYFLFRQNN